METREKKQRVGETGERGEGRGRRGNNNRGEVVYCVCLRWNASPYRAALPAWQEALEITHSASVSTGGGGGGGRERGGPSDSDTMQPRLGWTLGGRVEHMAYSSLSFPPPSLPPSLSEGTQSRHCVGNDCALKMEPGRGAGKCAAPVDVRPCRRQIPSLRPRGSALILVFAAKISPDYVSRASRRSDTKRDPEIPHPLPRPPFLS